MDLVAATLPAQSTLRIHMPCEHCPQPVWLRVAAEIRGQADEDGNQVEISIDREHAHLAVGAHYRQHER